MDNRVKKKVSVKYPMHLNACDKDFLNVDPVSNQTPCHYFNVRSVLLYGKDLQSNDFKLWEWERE